MYSCSYRVSVTVPSISTNALGYGAFLGIYANLRYQLLCGFDRSISSHFDVIGVTLFFSTALRYPSLSPTLLSHIYTQNTYRERHTFLEVWILYCKTQFWELGLDLIWGSRTLIFIYTHELEEFV